MSVTGNDPWTVLRAATRARVALGRAGDALPTARELVHRVARGGVRGAELQLAVYRCRPSRIGRGSSPSICLATG